MFHDAFVQYILLVIIVYSYLTVFLNAEILLRGFSPFGPFFDQTKVTAHSWHRFHKSNHDLKYYLYSCGTGSNNIA